MDVPYVNDGSAGLAREFERRFQFLPAGAGILFVGVDPVPVLGGEVTTFIIRLGISRAFHTDTGVALIRKLMEKEIESGSFDVQASVYRGVSGAGHDENPAGTRQHPS